MKKTKSGLKFTEEELSYIMYEGGLYDDDENELFETVSEKIVSTDTEKSSSTIRYVIKEIATGNLYKAELGKSPWYKQSEANAAVEWLPTKAKVKKVVVYD